MNPMNLSNKFSILIYILLLLTRGFLQAQTSDDVAIILKSKGNVQIKKEQAKNWSNADRGVRLDSGDMVKTSENSLAAIMFTDDKSLIKIRDNSTVSIRGKRVNDSISKRIVCSLGNFWVKVSQQKSKLLVETPSGVAAVKGTEFYGVVDSEGNTTIVVIDGIVQLLNKLGEVLVKAGQSGRLTKNGAPVVFQTDPNSGFNWAGDDKGDQELKFEFQDSDGNKKNLKIMYH